MPRTFLRMKAVPKNATLCKQLITIGIPMVFWWFSNSSLTVPKAPTTTGITVTLAFHSFYSCNLKSWYLVIFFSYCTLIFWSPGTAMSMILHSLFSLTTMSGISLYVWIAKSQSILYFSFPSTGSDWWESHLSSHSVSNFLHRSQCTFFRVFDVSSCIGFQLEQNTRWQVGRLSSCRACKKGTRPGDQCHLLLGSTFKVLSFPFQLTYFQPLPPPLILHPFCFSQEFTMQCFLFRCCLSVILSFFFILALNSSVATFRCFLLLFAA